MAPSTPEPVLLGQNVKTSGCFETENRVSFLRRTVAVSGLVADYDDRRFQKFQRHIFYNGFS